VLDVFSHLDIHFHLCNTCFSVLHRCYSLFLYSSFFHHGFLTLLLSNYVLSKMISMCGTGPPICYIPVASPGSLRGPHPPRFVPYPINPGAPMLPQEIQTLRASIIRQIEYYFR